MALNIKSIIIVVMYAVLSTLFLTELGKVGNICPDPPIKIDSGTIDIGTDADIKTTAQVFLDILFNRCEGLPSWIYWIIEVPTILGLLYIARGFIGLT